jgi:lipoprotein-anchoring transpeptidase ErfK/SrfK
VIVANFDEPVADRAAAERQLSVKTVPSVDGSWYWMDSRHAHWRPQSYYRPGTEVAAAGGDEGTSRVSFVIGESHVSIADDATKQIRVYRNDELVRTIPTSMGMGGSETVAGKTISFWTQPGVYTVMDKADTVVMDSSTYGLPVDSRLGYKLTVKNAVRLTNSGIYFTNSTAPCGRRARPTPRTAASTSMPTTGGGSTSSPNPETCSRCATPAASHCPSGRTVTGVCRGTSGSAVAPYGDAVGSNSTACSAARRPEKTQSAIDSPLT